MSTPPLTLLGSSLCPAALCLAALVGSPPASRPPMPRSRRRLAPTPSRVPGPRTNTSSPAATGIPCAGASSSRAGEWQVLFFVMDGDEPKRGSGEGGRYTFDGERLTFEHLHTSPTAARWRGLPASPLAMTARDGEGPLEPTGVEIDGDA